MLQDKSNRRCVKLVSWKQQQQQNVTKSFKDLNKWGDNMYL